MKQTEAVSIAPRDLLRVAQFSEKFPAFSQAALRSLILCSADRLNSRGERIPGNGLADAGAVLRLGRKVLIDEQAFFRWIASQQKIIELRRETRAFRHEVRAVSAETLLSRLEGVKRTGPGRWLAKCPAHDDRRPSLAMRELDDDRTLIHCFAGCAVEQILAAVGLTFDSLFPERGLSHRTKPERRPFNATDVLRAVAFEALVVAVAASNIRQGVVLSDADHERLVTASGRLQAAVGAFDE